MKSWGTYENYLFQSNELCKRVGRHEGSKPELGRLKKKPCCPPRTPCMKQIYLEDIIIRRAHLSDHSRIVQLQQCSLQVLCQKDYSVEQVKVLLKDKRDYKNWKWGETVFVAEYERTIVGFAARNQNWITAVYVHPEFTRKGIGSRLLNILEDDSRACGINSLFVDASITAKPFYDSLGYQMRTPVLICVRGVQVHCIEMRKVMGPGSDNRQVTFKNTSSSKIKLQSPLMVMLLIILFVKMAEWFMQNNGYLF
jgi:putative acetyltransferase